MARPDCRPLRPWMQAVDPRLLMGLDPALGGGVSAVEVLVRLAGPVAALYTTPGIEPGEALRDEDGVVRLVTARVRLDRIEALARMDGVQEIELSAPVAASSVFPQVGPSAPRSSARAPAMASVAPPPAVLIGVVDHAFDLLQPDLSPGVQAGGSQVGGSQVGGSADPTRVTRVHGFRALHPGGGEAGPQDVARAVRKAGVAGAAGWPLDHRPIGPDGRKHEHGTACAWLAGGGAAWDAQATPRAGLLLAALGGSAHQQGGPVGTGSLVTALAWMDQVAGRRPLVVLFSLATHVGPHDGSSLVGRALALVGGKPGRAVVVAAGNDNLLGRHVRAAVPRGGACTLQWRMGGPDDGGAGGRPDGLQIWGRRCRGLRGWITGPGLSQVVDLPPDHHGRIALRDGRRVVGWLSWDNRARWVGNGDPRISLHWTPALGAGLPSGSWGLRLEAVEAGRDIDPVPVVDAWLGVRDVTGLRWEKPQATRHAGTLSELATARDVIVVGNAALGLPAQRAPSPHVGPPGAWLHAESGCGPTRDGRPAPDIAARGTMVRVPCVRDRVGAGPSPVELRRFATGTSLAAARVAARCARILAAHPTMRVDALRRELAGVSTPAATTEGWGAGLLLDG